jgi:hypothetical protein
VNRRSLLAAGASALSFGVAGCVGALDPRGGDDRWAGVEPRYPDDRRVLADADTHHLFVENADATAYSLALTVVRTDGAEETLVWRATYRAPDERGFEIPDVLVTGRSYRVTAAIENGDRATVERAIEPCPHEGGSRNVGVWIEDATVSFDEDVCDEIAVGTTLPIGDHESFRQE